MLVQVIIPRRTLDETIWSETKRCVYYDFWEIKHVEFNTSRIVDAMLDERELFMCPHCALIFPYAFGADVGHPDPSAVTADEDAHLRQVCDRCWFEIISRSPLKEAA